jgi:hypothetical protein
MEALREHGGMSANTVEIADTSVIDLPSGNGKQIRRIT